MAQHSFPQYDFVFLLMRNKRKFFVSRACNALLGPHRGCVFLCYIGFR